MRFHLRPDLSNDTWAFTCHLGDEPHLTCNGSSRPHLIPDLSRHLIGHLTCHMMPDLSHDAWPVTWHPIRYMGFCPRPDLSDDTWAFTCHLGWGCGSGGKADGLIPSSSRSHLMPDLSPPWLYLFCGCTQDAGVSIIHCLWKVSSASFLKIGCITKHIVPHIMFFVSSGSSKPISSRSHNPDKRSTLASCRLPVAPTKTFKKRPLPSTTVVRIIECQPVQLKYSVWYFSGPIMGMCDPSIRPTHCGNPYLRSKYAAISFNFLLFRKWITSAMSTFSTAEQKSCTQWHTIVMQTPNKWQTLLYSELVASFHSAMVILFLLRNSS